MSEPSKLRDALNELCNVKMDDVLDVSDGGTTATVGFQITDFAGDPLAAAVETQFIAFDDLYLGTPSILATLATAMEGSIIDGEGSAALLVLTDENGRFQCKLTNLQDGTVYGACAPSVGGPLLDCRKIYSVTFSK